MTMGLPRRDELSGSSSAAVFAFSDVAFSRDSSAAVSRAGYPAREAVSPGKPIAG
jgi:hypothetical protein